MEKKGTPVILISIILIVVVAVTLICIYLKTPENAGSFISEDYTEEIDIGSKPTYNKGEISNYRQACKIGIEVINDQFPITRERTTWYNLASKYEVYRDEDSKLWLVYIIPRDTKYVVGGCYAVILTDDGDVVSCWGEK